MVTPEKEEEVGGGGPESQKKYSKNRLKKRKKPKSGANSWEDVSSYTTVRGGKLGGQTKGTGVLRAYRK